jgi:hypothetical protein
MMADPPCGRRMRPRNESGDHRNDEVLQFVSHTEQRQCQVLPGLRRQVLRHPHARDSIRFHPTRSLPGAGSASAFVGGQGCCCARVAERRGAKARWLDPRAARCRRVRRVVVDRSGAVARRLRLLVFDSFGDAESVALESGIGGVAFACRGPRGGDNCAIACCVRGACGGGPSAVACRGCGPRDSDFCTVAGGFGGASNSGLFAAACGARGSKGSAFSAAAGGFGGPGNGGPSAVACGGHGPGEGDFSAVAGGLGGAGGGDPSSASDTNNRAQESA